MKTNKKLNCSQINIICILLYATENSAIVYSIVGSKSRYSDMLYRFPACTNSYECVVFVR